MGGGGKGVCQPGVFCQRERRHCQPGKGTFQHQRKGPDQPHPGGKVHAGAQGKIGSKVAAQPDHRKRSAVGVLEDLQLLFPVAVAGKGVAGVGVAVQMDAPGDQHRDQAEACRLCRRRQGQEPPQAPQPPAHQPDEGEGAQSVPHIFFVPVKLRHRHRRKHGKGDGNRLQNDHFSTPL